jgi:hypothetical protein
MSNGFTPQPTHPQQSGNGLSLIIAAAIGIGGYIYVHRDKPEPNPPGPEPVVVIVDAEEAAAKAASNLLTVLAVNFETEADAIDAGTHTTSGEAHESLRKVNRAIFERDRIERLMQPLKTKLGEVPDDDLPGLSAALRSAGKGFRRGASE